MSNTVTPAPATNANSCTQSSAPDPGDIRNAWMKFYVVEDNYESPWMKVNDLVFPADTRLGTVSVPYTFTISGSGNSEIKTVRYVVGYDDNASPTPDEYKGYYISGEESVVITVYKPTGDFITGGGYVIPNQSAGTYATNAAGLKTNFGFNVKFNKKATSLQGNMNFIIRRVVSGVVRSYQIKSNSMTSLGVDATNPNMQTAVFVSKANLTDITNPLAPISLGGNLRLEVNMIDRGEPGSSDEIGIQLTTTSNTLLYSSNWVVNNTVQISLDGGNLVVHSGFNVGTDASKTPTITTGINENPAKLLTAPDKRFTMGVKVFDVKAWPNPSTQYFNLNIESSNKDEQVVVKVFDISGKLIHVVKGAANNNFRFGDSFISGTYFVEISQGSQRKLVKILKQTD